MRQVRNLASRRGTAAGAILLALILAGCAAGPRPSAPGSPAPVAAANGTPRHDPLEGMNRGLYRVGDSLDRGIVHPIVAVYRRIVPRPVRQGVHNVLQNLDEPVVFVNDVLQGHPKAAGTTVIRFAANSTVGVAGIFDAAATAGLPHHDNGFGSTLGHYGVAPGPFIYLPLLGPTTLRDAFGEGVDFVADPLSWTRFGNAQTVGIARTSLDLLDEREQADARLRALRNTAADPYATLRSVYLQSREAEIKGPEAPLETLPELPEPSATPEPPPAPGTAPEAPATAPAPTEPPPTP